MARLVQSKTGTQALKKSSSAVPKADVATLRQLIADDKPKVIIISAEWCGDCVRQNVNLPAFQKNLAAAGAEVYSFTAEIEYDVFVTPAHKELAMKIFNAPLGSPILGDAAEGDAKTSVIGKRGREGYPATFLISKGAVLQWSIEDVSERQLADLTNTFLKLLA